MRLEARLDLESADELPKMVRSTTWVSLGSEKVQDQKN